MEQPSRSAFIPLRPEANQIDPHLVDQQCQRIISSHEELEIGVFGMTQQGLPALMRLFLGFYNSLYSKFDKNWQTSKIRTILNIRSSLFKLMTSAIQKKLFRSTQQSLFEEIRLSLVFKPLLSPFVFSIISENTNDVVIDRYFHFHRAITSEQYQLYLPIQIYFLYGGSLFTIESKTFKEKIIALAEALGKTLSTLDTAVSRNIEYFKGSRERKAIIDESVKTVMFMKKKENLVEVAQKLTNSIFGGRDYLNKEEFLIQVQRQTLDPIISIFLLLIRSEFILFEERAFLSQIGSQHQTENRPNFYANEMSKLFNKCPFNGDERCNCKKCQCVRRNRESAKLNQEKKRNAVEQVQIMRKKIEQLEQREFEKNRKISELEEQNLLLKTILKEIKSNPSLKEKMRETIEPVSKVLNNEL